MSNIFGLLNHASQMWKVYTSARKENTTKFNAVKSCSIFFSSIFSCGRVIIFAFDNQGNAYYSSRFKSGPRVLCCPAGIDRAISGFGRHFVVAGTLGLDLTRQASTLCSRHETILDDKRPIERTCLIFDYY